MNQNGSLLLEGIFAFFFMQIVLIFTLHFLLTGAKKREDEFLQFRKSREEIRGGFSPSIPLHLDSPLDRHSLPQ